ncbi:hypothetical protein ACOBQB_21330 [Streptomyces sp. G5(2025)]|uniref:hypothetical protein n=1 Tax=Streptomyces sp. G5(2025) TaxID=3406628 RepID=UPI003C1D72DE
MGRHVYGNAYREVLRGLAAPSSVLLAQGFGSAITEAVWDTGFGVSALLRVAHAAAWADLGVAGCVLLAVAARRRIARKTP